MLNPHPIEIIENQTKAKINFLPPFTPRRNPGFMLKKMTNTKTPLSEKIEENICYTTEDDEEWKGEFEGNNPVIRSFFFNKEDIKQSLSDFQDYFDDDTLYKGNKIKDVLTKIFGENLVSNLQNSPEKISDTDMVTYKFGTLKSSPNDSSQDSPRGCGNFMFTINNGFPVECGDIIWDEVKGIKKQFLCPSCRKKADEGDVKQ